MHACHYLLTSFLSHILAMFHVFFDMIGLHTLQLLASRWREGQVMVTTTVARRTLNLYMHQISPFHA